MLPFWFAGAVGDAENLDILAALTANPLRQPSELDTLSSIFAAVTVPELSTVIKTVTSPAPIHL